MLWFDVEKGYITTASAPKAASAHSAMPMAFGNHTP